MGGHTWDDGVLICLHPDTPEAGFGWSGERPLSDDEVSWVESTLAEPYVIDGPDPLTRLPTGEDVMCDDLGVLWTVASWCWAGNEPPSSLV